MVLQDDSGLMWNEMTRLPDQDFVYKALPARTKQQAPKLPAKSSLVQRGQLEATADGQPVGLPALWQKLWHCNMHCWLISRYVCVVPCLYVCVCVAAYTCMLISVCVCVCAHTSTCMCVYVSVCLSVSVCASVCLCLSVCVCMSVKERC